MYDNYVTIHFTYTLFIVDATNLESVVQYWKWITVYYIEIILKHSCSFSCPIDSCHFYFQIVKLQFIIQYTQYMCVWYSVWVFSATIQTLYFTNAVVRTRTVPIRVYVHTSSYVSNRLEYFEQPHWVLWGTSKSTCIVVIVLLLDQSVRIHMYVRTVCIKCCTLYLQYVCSHYKLFSTYLICYILKCTEKLYYVPLYYQLYMFLHCCHMTVTWLSHDSCVKHMSCIWLHMMYIHTYGYTNW